MRNATKAYQRSARVAASPRDSELLAFGLVNRALASADTPPARVAALGRNHELWGTLVRDLSATGNGLPEELKSRLLALGGWSMDYSTRALLTDLPIEPLLEVNRNIADGLRAQAG